MPTAKAVCLLLFTSLPSASADSLRSAGGGNGGVASLERQAARIAEGLRRAKREQLYAFDQDTCHCQSGNGAQPAGPELLDDWVKENCGGWGEGSSCVARVVQDVKRIAPYNRTVEFSGAHFTEQAMRTLKQQALGYLQEHQDTLTSVRHVIGSLVGDAAVRGVTAAETADRIREAERFNASPDKTVSLHVGLPAASPEDGGASGLVAEKSCHCFSITQARSLWDDAVDTDSSATAAASAVAPVDATLPDMSLPSPLRKMVKDMRASLSDTVDTRRLESEEQKEIAEETKLEESNDPQFEHYVDVASRKYAKHHKVLTWIFLLGFEFGTVMWEPVYDCGPLLPEYTTQCCGCHWAPCSNVYRQGYSFPAAFAGIFYFDSYPYGIFTSNPGCLAYIGANPSGRQWPERSICGSHPCGSVGHMCDGGDNNEFIEIYEAAQKHHHSHHHESRRLAGAAENEELYSQAGQELLSTRTGDRVFFAPEGHVYDARLVEALFSFADKGVKVKVVTLFTTRLTQLKVMGWNPDSSSLQHLGVTLELSKPVEHQGFTCRFLTLEMMAPGLMWTCGASGAPSENYDYQQKHMLTYDELSPAVVARYIAGQRDRTYSMGKTDCQTVALELAQRLALHGRRLQSSLVSVHVQVMHAAAPAAEATWQNTVDEHIRSLLRGADDMTVQVNVGEAVARCPSPAGSLKAMSEEANAAWESCSSPLALTPIELKVRTEHLDIQEVTRVLDVLSDEDGFGEGSGIFLSLPQVGITDFEHGPSYAQWKSLANNQFDMHFALVVVIAGLVLAMLIWVIYKVVQRVTSAESESARSPWRRYWTPALFLMSLATGTVGAPLMVGAWHVKSKKDSKQPEGYTETDLTASKSEELMQE